MNFRNTAIVCMIMLSGCASMPDVKLGYYLPKVENLEITVIQSAACTAGNVPVLDSIVSVEPIFSRDINTYQSIDLREVDGQFTNTNFTLSLFDDGRIKGLNATQVGKGTEIVKASIAAVGGALSVSGSDCKQLNSLVGKKGEALTIKHKAEINFSSASASITLKQSTLSTPDFIKVQSIFGKSVSLSYRISRVNGICEFNNRAIKPEDFCGQSNLSSYPARVVLRQPDIADFIVSAGPTGKVSNMTFAVPVPQKGYLYSLPIPKPPVFGGNSFELTIGESGRVASIKYGKDTGIAQALNAASAVRSASRGKTTSEKVSGLKARADLIAAQQRLVRCEAKPEDCK